MKKLLSVLTLFAFTLYANEAPSIETPDTKFPPDVVVVVDTTPTPPIHQRVEKPSGTLKATAALIGTLAVIAIGLFASGRDTGTHYYKSTDKQQA